MPENHAGERVSALLAERDRSLCAQIECYAGTQPLVELCAVVHDADRVLELLHAGLRPQVLVLDAVLPGCGLPELLRRLPGIEAGYHPHILLSTVPLDSARLGFLLTLGVEYTILKPYPPQTLFNDIYLLACRTAARVPYLLHENLWELLLDLQVDVCGCGARYLEEVVRPLLLENGICTLGELYAQVALREQLSVAAVVSGIRRLAMQAHGARTAAWAALCTACGRSADAPLTNAEFIHSVAEHLRHTLP